MVSIPDSDACTEARAAALRICAEAGLASDDADLVITGDAAPKLPSRFPIAIGAAAVIGACGLAMAELWRIRSGRSQRVGVDLGRSAAALLGFRLQRVNGAPAASPGDDNPLVGLYRCRDGRWIALHGGFPSLEQTTLRVLDAQFDRDSITRAVARRDAPELEDALAQARMCGAVVRDAEQWRATPQGALLSHRPLVEIVRIGDAPPQPLPEGDRPLSGVRALDFTRVLAGPTCGKYLACGGADVLLGVARKLPNVEAYVIETGHGKRSALVDLDEPTQRARALELARDADVFVDSYRVGSLAARGFSPEALAERRPGIVAVSISCYGVDGPWRARPGWELLGQAVSGLAAGQGEPGEPKLIRAYACDYPTGFLAAFGAMVALGRRATEGGSWHVRVNLARTGMYMERFGVRYVQVPGLDGGLDRYCVERDSAFGRIRHLPPPFELSETPARWDQLAVPLGTHAAQWLSRNRYGTWRHLA
jgi:crotonobetainyl-CoA:carnitine CoA-transferase CaiB-like acyl-CoA transferase